MAEPYIKEITIGGFTVTSVVLDQEDFNDLCDEIAELRIFEGNSGKEILAKEQPQKWSNTSKKLNTSQ
jgi:hypothetical protein